MKLLIVEGQDRTGKNSLIEKIADEYPNSETIHWGFPEGNTNEEKTEYQKTTFDFWMRDYRFKSNQNKLDLLIWNRSHVGEYVYGPMYRGTDPEWIFKVESEFLKDDPEVYLVLLYADPAFLLQNEDGKSFTSVLEKKQEELERFFQAFGKSGIANKQLIKVNHEDSYISEKVIADSVKKLLTA